jgi:hypothetical protein
MNLRAIITSILTRRRGTEAERGKANAQKWSVGKSLSEIYAEKRNCESCMDFDPSPYHSAYLAILNDSIRVKAP